MRVTVSDGVVAPLSEYDKTHERCTKSVAIALVLHGWIENARPLAASLGLGLLSVLPRFIFLPYLVQWLETLWGIFHPAVKWKPVRIGIRQLIVSVVWTILFIATWRF